MPKVRAFAREAKIARFSRVPGHVTGGVPGLPGLGGELGRSGRITSAGIGIAPGSATMPHGEGGSGNEPVVGYASHKLGASRKMGIKTPTRLTLGKYIKKYGNSSN